MVFAQLRSGCTRRLTKTLLLPVGGDRKTRTAQRTNKIAGFVIVPSEKKINENLISELRIKT